MLESGRVARVDEDTRLTHTDHTHHPQFTVPDAIACLQTCLLNSRHAITQA